MHIHAVDFHFPQMFIRLGLLEKIIFAVSHMLHDLIRKKRVSFPPRGFGHAILCEAVDEIDIRAQELMDARQLLDNVIAVMHHELQIERGEGFARPAWAGCPRL